MHNNNQLVRPYSVTYTYNGSLDPITIHSYHGQNHFQKKCISRMSLKVSLSVRRNVLDHLSFLPYKEEQLEIKYHVALMVHVGSDPPVMSE